MTNNNRKKRLQEVQKHNRMVMKRLCKVLLGFSVMTGMVWYHNHEINKLKIQNQTEVNELKDKLAFEEKNTMAYEIMYNNVSQKVNTYKQERDEAVAQYNHIQEQIKYSKLNNKTPNRGDYANKTLTE